MPHPTGPVPAFAQREQRAFLDQGQATRLRKFLKWFIPLFFIIGPIDVALYFIWGDLTNLLMGVLVLALGGVFWLARRAVVAGNVERGVVLTTTGVLAPVLVLAFLRPYLYPVLAVGCILGVAIALPFVTRRTLGRLSLAAWGLAIMVVSIGVTLQALYPRSIPSWYSGANVAVTMAFVVGLVLLMLWLLSGRLREHLDEAQAAHKALATSHAQLKHLGEAKGQFINNAAHELNTPLTPIRIHLELLRRDLAGHSNAGVDRNLVVLDRNVQRLGRLISDLLDASRLEGGRLRMQSEPVGVHTLVAEAAQDFEGVARESGIQLRVAVEGEFWIKADALRFSQVLHNLLVNATKFTPYGGQVELSATSKDGSVEVRVRDTGIGLADDELRRLFRPFSQVGDQSPASARPGGVGLGLYIAKGIVENAGGTITAQSAGRGLGSTFVVRVPQLSTRQVQSPGANGKNKARMLRLLSATGV